ncbi:MAG: type II toxin-antitoxin system PemK/MazF family toxin [Anaerolineae bacterium]|jgi:mRNA interferase MazF
MGPFAKGDVIIASLNYSDFSGSKRRPALVVAAPDDLDPVLCLITSRIRDDGYDVTIRSEDFASGGLNRDSTVRVCHLFSLDPSLIDYKAGVLRPAKIQEVTSGIVAMLTD